MSEFELQGLSLIGAQRGTPGGAIFHAVDPGNGENLAPAFHSASSAEIDRAAQLAALAAPALARLDGAQRGVLLKAIAANLEIAREDFERLIPVETGLPRARAAGELTRTIAQLRLFADWVEEGSWVEARIEHGDPSRTPLPRPDLRSMLYGIGPVVVFGASNFPLAFSVAGGDTASALAAGCPVIVKAHPAHPATSERAGLAIRAAVARCGLPEGTFSLLFDASTDVGAALLRNPHVRAVAFTGSRQGGRALLDLAAVRPDPIPVFAEMGSVNPIFVLPAALASRGSRIASQVHASALQGLGQFCTNPGLLMVPDGADGDAFVHQLSDLFASSPAGNMLTAAIARHHTDGVQQLASRPGVRTLQASVAAPRQAAAALLEVDAETFLRDSSLQTEVFGPCSLLVRCVDAQQMLAVAQHLEGQLTASVIADDADHAQAASLLDALQRIAGRVLMNGVPTGVEVSHAMVHGGPWPASSAGFTGSVGTAAMLRFCRRVCWQDVPDSLLPQVLQEANPLGLQRLVDGQRRA